MNMSTSLHKFAMISLLPNYTPLTIKLREPILNSPHDIRAGTGRPSQQAGNSSLRARAAKMAGFGGQRHRLVLFLL